MVLQPKNGAASRCLITPNALENARSIVHHVIEHVDRRISPGDELAISPDFHALRHSIILTPLRLIAPRCEGARVRANPFCNRAVKSSGDETTVAHQFPS